MSNIESLATRDERNPETIITPNVTEKIKLIFTTLIDLIVEGVNRMKKESPVVDMGNSSDKSIAEKKVPIERPSESPIPEHKVRCVARR